MPLAPCPYHDSHRRTRFATRTSAALIEDADYSRSGCPDYSRSGCPKMRITLGPVGEITLGPVGGVGASSTRTCDRAAMHSLTGHDYYEATFFESRSDVRRCSACGELLSKWDEDLSRVALEKPPKWDLAVTLDGVQLASGRFRDVVERGHLSGLTFRALSTPALYSMRPNQVVKFDPRTPGLKLEGLCSVCGRYRTVVGAYPVRLLPTSSLIANGFARTDLEFGSGDEKTPVILCGDDAAAILRQAKLRGLELVSEED